MPGFERHLRPAWLTGLSLAGYVVVVCVIWLPYLPNQAGLLGPDYAYWLPNLLTGYFWHLSSPWWAMPWFSPAECGGVPLHANPQGAYLSLPQMLAGWLGPITAIRTAFAAYALAGCTGAWFLARVRFGLMRPAALLAAALFTFNGLFAVRMIVGHLSFGPFMLLPAMAACLTGAPAGPQTGNQAGDQGGDQAGAQAGAQAGKWAGKRARLVLRACAFGVLAAVCVQAGSAVLMPPMMISLLLVCLIHGLATGGSLARGAALLLTGGVLGLCLCAGKLAAVGALLAHVSRDSYPLPGFLNLAETAWVAFRGVFFWPTDGMSGVLAHSAVLLELHEFDYRTGPVPLVLMAAWLSVAWRGRMASAPVPLPARLTWYALFILLIVPLALNTLMPGWTRFLKSVPIIGSSSSLLRWFAAYILPACLGGAVALDRLARRGLPVWTGGPWAMLAASVAVTALMVALPDRSVYGPHGIGNYDPSRIVAGFSAARATGRAPPVTGMTQLVNNDGSPDMSLARQDALTRGLSQITCYEPLFGYRLETLPKGVLHPGSVFDAVDGPRGRHLNLIDPACYVFPGANGCIPGDGFPAADLDQARAFIGYRPWAFAKPVWATLADWLGIVTGLATMLAAGAAGVALWRNASRA